MGAVTFSIDVELIKILCGNLPINTFVETGTFKGDAIELVKNQFQKIYSIELSKEYYQDAMKRFSQYSHIQLLQGDSAQLLATTIATLQNQPLLFWLDAHWCVANATAGEFSQCPLLDELNAIGPLHKDSVILIDDARLFLAPPPVPHEITQWPSFHSILKTLSQLSQTHNLIILNDCLLFYPQHIETAVCLFAHQHNINWLNVLDKSRDYDKLHQQLIEKEDEINKLKAACNDREQALFDVYAENTQEKEKNHLLTNELAKKNKSLRYLENITNARDLSFVNDINDHYSEIYKELINAHKLIIKSSQELRTAHQEVVRASHESISDLKNKYATVVQEKLKIILPVQKRIIASLKYERHAWLNRISKRIELFFTPKLGELNLYPPRPFEIPKRYTKIIRPTRKKLPTISIVTPSYNHGRFIERTIRSVIEQNYAKLEYIIQDSESNDETTEIIQRYQGTFKNFESFKDEGQSQAINLGFRHATGEIMSYLNSDDILLPGALHYVGHYFATHPDVDVVYGHRILINERDKEIGRWILPPHDSEVLSWADYVPQETLFWRRSIWEKAGGKIDESFRFAMDWDLLLRFKEVNAKFVRLPRFLGAFRIHQTQKTSAELSETGMKEMQRLRERCHGRVITPEEIVEATRTYLNRHLLCHKLYRAGVFRY